MAFLQFKNARMAGIAAAVPKSTVNNLHPSQEDNISSDYSPTEFVEETGINERRISDTLTASDLCFAAAERLISDLGWEKTEIEALVFVSQMADYILPATACILQDRLGLGTHCYAEDIALGCSGWIYGLSNVVSLMASGGIKKALLLAGDGCRREKGKHDPLFGYAGTATAIVFDKDDEGFKFHFGTDGSGFDAIVVPDGGARNPITTKSFETEEINGRSFNRLQNRMKGLDVFSFGISTVPNSIKQLANHYGFDYLSTDYLVLHQANKKMNDVIAMKLKLPQGKVPSSLRKFGNTSSASIPLTIITELKGQFETKPTNFLCCGFGVGLSWGSVAFQTHNIIVSNLIELDDESFDHEHIV